MHIGTNDGGNTWMSSSCLDFRQGEKGCSEALPFTDTFLKSNNWGRVRPPPRAPVHRFLGEDLTVSFLGWRDYS